MAESESIVALSNLLSSPRLRAIGPCCSGIMETEHQELLRSDELDIALRLSYLQHNGGGAGSSAADVEARRKEKKKQKDLKVRLPLSRPDEGHAAAGRSPSMFRWQGC